MRFLVNTNVFLEILLAQTRANEARQFLESDKGGELSSPTSLFTQLVCCC